MNTNSPESNHNVYQTDPFHHTDEQDVAFTTIHTENNSSDKKENICDQIEYYRHRYPRLELGLKLIYQVIAGFLMFMFLYYFIENYISLLNLIQDVYAFASDNIHIMVYFMLMYIVLLILIGIEVIAQKSEKSVYRALWIFWALVLFLLLVLLSSKQEEVLLKNEDLFNENYLLIGFVAFLSVTFIQYVKMYILAIRNSMANLYALFTQQEATIPKEDRENFPSNTSS